MPAALSEGERAGVCCSAQPLSACARNLDLEVIYIRLDLCLSAFPTLHLQLLLLSLLSALCPSATTATTMTTMTARRRSQVHPNLLAALCDGVDTILKELPPRPSGSKLHARCRTLFGIQLSTPLLPKFNEFCDLYNADGTCMTFCLLHDVSYPRCC
jgi:hypothetical protein